MTDLPPTSTVARRGPRAFVPGLLAGLAHSAGTLCMYREGSPWLGLVMIAAVVAITWVGARSPRPFRTALGVYLGCVPGTYLNHLFMADYALAGYLLLPFEFALFPAGFAWLMGRLSRGEVRRVVWMAPVAWRVVLEVAPHPVRRVVWMAPVAWVAAEYLRGELVLGGNPWFTVAHVVTGWPGMMAAASKVGAYGVSGLLLVGAGAIIALAASTFGLMPRQRPATGFQIRQGLALLIVTSTFFLVAGWGSASATPLVLKVGVIQTNLSRADKQAREVESQWLASQRWHDLSRRAAAAGAQVIVWPETMFAGVGLDAGTQAAVKAGGLFFPSTFERGAGPERIFLDAFYDDLVALQREIGVPMLVGSVAFDQFRLNPRPEGGRVKFEHDRRYNSVFHLHDGAVDPVRYDKRRLVPFGEYLPLIQYIPGATKWIASTVGSLVPLDCTPGMTPRVFEIPRQAGGAGGPATPARVVTPICFEAMYGSTVRTLAYQKGQRVADVIINPSNDNWFGEASWSAHWIRYAHLANASWRCAELGLPMVRAVNTGRSCLIDARGVVVNDRLSGQPGEQAFNDNTEGFAVYDVPLPEAEFTGTLYARIGDVVPWGCVVVSGLAVVWVVVRGRSRTIEPAR